MQILNEIPVDIKKGQMVCFDLEMYGQDVDKLHRPHGTFACISIAVEGREEVYQLYDTGQIKKLFLSMDKGHWVGHNLLYDIKQLTRFLPIKPHTLHDTMLVEQALFGGYYQNFSLKDLVRRYLGEVMEKEVRDDFESRVEMTKEMKQYAAKDASYTLRIAQIQRREYEGGPGWSAYRDIDEKMIWPVLDMQGVPVDAGLWEKTTKEFEEVAERNQAELGFNVNSQKQVLEAVKKAGIHILDTKADTLLAYAGIPVIDQILLTRMYRKATSTYGMKWLEKNVEADGKVYSGWKITGAECLPAGELVLTNRGYLPVERVVVGDSVITHLGRPKKVLASFPNGIKKIYKITSDNGLELRTTGNHPYLLDSGEWKNASDLSLSDKVVVHSSKEEWKKLQDWSDDFSVSSWGRVRNDTTKRIVTQYKKDEWGHLKVLLFRNGAQTRGEDRKDFPVHRLVAKAFLETPCNRHDATEVRHLNGIAWDNTERNLSWGTRRDNIEDAVSQGSMSKQGRSVFTEEDVNFIRTASHYRGFDSVVAKEFGVSREAVRDIRLGKRWKNYEGKEKRVTFYTASIVSIEIESEEMTYGLTIEDDSSHITGGFITHNTGRMSSANPNLQNIPQRKLPIFRTFFTASKGNMFVVDDVSQQEPCILAYESKDRILTNAIIDGEDLHLTVAREIFNDPSMQKSDPRRGIGKTINLGTSYGLSEHGLSKKLDISTEEAAKFLRQYFMRFTGVFNWIGQMRQSARQSGYIKTSAGRRVFMNPYDTQSENNAINAPIQGGAADFTKMWVRKYWEKCNENGLPYTLCLIVHDETGYNTPKEIIKDTNKIRAEAFQETAETLFPGIPFKSEYEIGRSWAAKSIKEEMVEDEEWSL